jgi:hypothetical protein
VVVEEVAAGEAGEDVQDAGGGGRGAAAVFGVERELFDPFAFIACRIWRSMSAWMSMAMNWQRIEARMASTSPASSKPRTVSRSGSSLSNMRSSMPGLRRHRQTRKRPLWTNDGLWITRCHAGTSSTAVTAGTVYPR